MEFKETKLNGVYVIENNIFNDERGKFVKTFNFEEFSKQELYFNLKESFYTVSKKGVIRGMHFQTPPFEHAKIVYVVSGKINDVVVDLRKQSPTFGEFICIELSEENNKSIYVPKGFAHGFEVISDSAKVVYLTSSVYSPENDEGILWNSFGFKWNSENPILSERDKNFIKLNEFESVF